MRAVKDLLGAMKGGGASSWAPVILHAPEIVQEVREGKYSEAADTTLENLPVVGEVYSDIKDVLIPKVDEAAARDTDTQNLINDTKQQLSGQNDALALKMAEVDAQVDSIVNQQVAIEEYLATIDGSVKHMEAEAQFLYPLRYLGHFLVDGGLAAFDAEVGAGKVQGTGPLCIWTVECWWGSSWNHQYLVANPHQFVHRGSAGTEWTWFELILDLLNQMNIRAMP